MADIGVLSLQIHSNSTAAENSLRRLEGALLAIKAATNSTGLGKVASALKKINESINIQTITNLNGLAASMEKLQRACNFTVPNLGSLNRVRTAMEGMQRGANAANETAQAVEKMSDGFAYAAPKVGELKNNIQSVLDFSKFDPAKLPFGALGSRIDEDSRQLQKYGAIAKDAFETVRQIGSNQLLDNFKKAEAEKTNAINSVDKAAEEGRKKLDEMQAKANELRDKMFALGTEAHRLVTIWAEGLEHRGTPASDLKEMEANYRSVNEQAIQARKEYDAVCAAMEQLREETGITETLRRNELTTEEIYIKTIDEEIRKQKQLNSLKRINDANSRRASYIMGLPGDQQETMLANASGEVRDMVTALKSMSEASQKIVEIQGQAMSAKDAINMLLDSLNTPITTNWSQAIDNMMGIKAEAKSATESMSVFLNAMAYDKTPMADTLRSMNPELAETANEMRKMGATISEETLPKLIDLDGELKKKKSDASGAAGAFAKFRGALGQIKNGAMVLLNPLKNLGKQIWSITRRMAIRAVIRQFTSALQEGVQNVYEYSKAIGSTFAPSMDEAAIALQQMKNSIAAAVTPAIQALIPLLQSVVNQVINILNYVNQFIALMAGQSTWLRALPATTTAFGKQEKAAKKAGAAVKDLLADWDELNIIQSETSGAGSGVGTSTAEDYLSMFETVVTFDKRIRDLAEFVKENFEKIKAIAVEIGNAITLWRLSKSFTGVLDKMTTLLLYGVIIKLTIDTTNLFDNAYVESGNVTNLLVDGIMTGALAAISNKLVGASFGEAAGTISASVIFAISAGATFSVAENVYDEGKKKFLLLLGGVKLALASALMTMRFIKLGMGTAVSLVGGVLAVTVIAAITYSLEVSAKNAETAKEMAEKAFAKSGTEGINPSEYLTELQKKFDELTEGDHLVLNTFVDVPDLSGKLTSAMAEIQSFNSVVTGQNALTEEDAKNFKATWDIILGTLDDMNTKTYDTILAGLDSALATANEKLKQRIGELRVSFIQIEKNLDEQTAKLYSEMQEIVDKIASNTATEEDIERYTFIWKVIAEATDEGFKDLQSVITKAKRFDFGADNAVENATQFIKDIGTAGDKATSAIEESMDDTLIALNMERKKTQAYFDNGLISKEVYDGAMTMYQDMEDAIIQAAEEKKKSVQDSMQEAFDMLFNQALKYSNGTPTYWRKILLPLIEQVKSAGGSLSGEMMDAIRRSIEGEMFQAGGILLETAPNWNLLSSEEIINWITRNLDFQMGNLKSQMPDYAVEIIDLFHITGWDLLTEEMRNDFAISLAEALGDTDKTRQVLASLGFDSDKITEILGQTTRKNVEQQKANVSGIEQPADYEAYKDLIAGFVTEHLIRFPNEDFDTMLEYLEVDLDEYDAIKDLIGQELINEIIRQTLDDLQKAGESGTSGFQFNPYRVTGAAGASDVGTKVPSFVMPGNTLTSEEDFEKSMGNAVRDGNEKQEEQNDETNRLLRQLLAKNWTINVAPTTGWGLFGRKSNEMAEAVTGVES